MISSFPPLVDSNTKILIMGTMPGVMSFTKQEYYGNKKNQFWKIMFSLFSSLPVSEQFTKKVNLLKEHKIGLWDVLANCERKGSLDMDIKNHIENDIESLLQQFPNIKQIVFNGKESYRYFIKKFRLIDGIKYHVMPSTSTANTMRFEKKLKLWKEMLN